jgi:hypothetical protein
MDLIEPKLELISPILIELSVKKDEFNNRVINLNNEIIEYYLDLKFKTTKREINYLNNVISKYLNESQKIKERNYKDSFLFNPLTFFSIGETLHSFLLANLLDPNGMHGQGKLFLKTFLKLLDIEIAEKDNWIVTAEKGRIDLLLKRTFPHTVIIIENKSNFAIDQEHQLYRYWYQEIYIPNKDRHGEKTDEVTSNNNLYQIIYLTPVRWKKPDENSITKPMGYDKSLPDKIPITPKIWVFNENIVEWLSNSINELHSDNHRLREYLIQYIELWKFK